MTNDELSTNNERRKTCGSRLVISLFRSSKSLQRSGAMLWLRAIALERQISIQERRERPCVGSACSLARANALKEFLFGDCVISFIVIGANACPRSDQLTDDSISDRTCRDPFRKVNYRFSKTSGSLL